MAQAVHPERRAIGPREDGGLDFATLSRLSLGGAALLRQHGARHLVFLAVNSPAFPVSIMSAAYAGVPIVPLNYRLSVDQIAEQIRELDAPLVVVDPAYVAAVQAAGVPSMLIDDFVKLASEIEPLEPEMTADDSVAVVLFTSGTTSKPKAVLLRHQHLMSYLMQTIEFGSADAETATLVSNPPYHVAGVGAVLSNLYAGRRLVYLANFTPSAWLETVRAEGISNVMLVPTMLARILEHLDGAPADTPSLRGLSYGGARMPEPVLLKALEAFPEANFVNAYGLTETSSTIAVLGPEDHRLAISDPSQRHLLFSAGRPVPGIELQIRSEAGDVLENGETGLLWVRGSQVSGEYQGLASALDASGWFPTRDRARLEDGYLFIGGRADDTIIRGGENIAPAEIEDVLVNHPGVRELAVIGLPDDEWGERIVAVIVPATEIQIDEGEVRAWCRTRLRGSRTPDQVIVIEEFPRTDTGKIIRPKLLSQLVDAGQA
ncbi:class I adenylate-forming enzyme family protein [Leucobacter exalbidus]|uniref:class I adenylate-forming enzyme family protein n=1 Tax=Leucobacter exalbidus TaxID=662960 RepID=UPI001FD751D8|nr:fatty acid--CoA ligase family protein [Leucobacter exalbidus]